MKRGAAILGVAGLALGVGWWWLGGSRGPEEKVEAVGKAEERRERKTEIGRIREADAAGGRRPGGEAGMSVAEKAARIERIKRDYDEVRAKVAADYTAAGAAFPGGLQAFLKQLALLEREKRADFAGFLTPAELEDLEYRETNAGQTVERLLGGAATEAQRRAAFRLQLGYEDKYALAFDVSPQALLERERDRQQVQQQIRAAIGDEAFAVWLKGEGADFEKFTAFVGAQGLAKERAFEMWEVKNEFVRKRLELVAQNVPAEQLRTLQGALTRETQARIVGILGPGATELAQREVLGWLPAK